MPRQARKDLRTPFLHVMVQGVNKEYIFCKKEHKEKYLETIATQKEKKTFNLLAYCIMDNHAHLLFYVEDINEFGKFMHKVNLTYAQMYNKEEKRCGVLFRNRYRAEPIYDMKYLVNCIKYIHNNPVKANMVEKCEDYLYSSYNDYINKVGLSQTKIIKETFGENCDFAELFDTAYDKRYIDVDDENLKNVNEYISSGITEYCKDRKIAIIDIFTDRSILIDTINHLKVNCGIKYVEIRDFFNISRGVMDKLKK